MGCGSSDVEESRLIVVPKVVSSALTVFLVAVSVCMERSAERECDKGFDFRRVTLALDPEISS